LRFLEAGNFEHNIEGIIGYTVPRKVFPTAAARPIMQERVKQVSVCIFCDGDHLARMKAAIGELVQPFHCAGWRKTTLQKRCKQPTPDNATKSGRQGACGILELCELVSIVLF